MGLGERPHLIANSSRIQQIQADMTYRALELLNLPPDQPAFLLDIGCGSGLSGEILDEQGHVWVGVDVAPSMLGIIALINATTFCSQPLLLRRGCSREGGRGRSISPRHWSRFWLSAR